MPWLATQVSALPAALSALSNAAAHQDLGAAATAASHLVTSAAMVALAITTLAGIARAGARWARSGSGN